MALVHGNQGIAVPPESPVTETQIDIGILVVRIDFNGFFEELGRLCIGTGVLDPPLKSMWGDWYLQFPIIGPIGMPPIPAEGVLVIPGTIPASPPPPYSIPLQALIGAELSNLSVLEVD